MNGEVEVIMPDDGNRVVYGFGDSFGVKPNMQPQYHRGVMRTTVDDCQFVCVAQKDFCDIMNKARDNLKRHKNAAGEIVSETEKRSVLAILMI